MKEIYFQLLYESVLNGRVECDICGWSWKLSDGGKDKFICHKCGHDNTPNKSNLDMVFSEFQKKFPEQYLQQFDNIKKFISKYIISNKYNIKFVKNCSSGVFGVRTKDYIIICSPTKMATFGDFIYTLFHEIRHESQISKIKMTDPLSEMDFEDFESLYKQYWEMELDADQFAKNMVGQIVKKLNIPIEIAQQHLSLSDYVKNYPSMSKMIELQLKQIVSEIKKLKNKGEYKNISDHPLVKNLIDKVEPFI